MRIFVVVLLAGVLLVPAFANANAGQEADRVGSSMADVDASVLDGQGMSSAIVSLAEPLTPEIREELADHSTIVYAYSIIDAVHVRVTPDQARQMADLDVVTRIDADEALELHLETSRQAVGVNQEVWDYTNGGANSTIAVVDTGIDSTHPGVSDRLKQGVVFSGNGGAQEMPASSDEDGHGTHVGAITGGDGDGSKRLAGGSNDYAGVANQAGLVSLDISESFTTSTAIRAFEWVHNNHEEFGIEVVQNSWGRKDTGGTWDPDDPAIRASDSLVRDDDLVVVFSAANEGPKKRTLALEAMNPNVISVAATDDQGKIAEFSSRGPVVYENGTKAPWTKPDVAAPGVSITSAAAGATAENYVKMSGTSQAAPHVAGIAALIRAQHPDLSAIAIQEVLERSARDLGESGPDPETGYGFVSASRALELAASAANGTLFSSTENYVEQGRVTAETPVDDILPPDEGGLHKGNASGTIPVKRSATNLNVKVEWTQAQDGLSTPKIEVTVEDPSGNRLLVPSDGMKAERSFDDPAPGEWTWHIQASGTGAADYVANSTVTLETGPQLAGGASPDSGFFDKTFDTQRINEAARDFANGLANLERTPVLITAVAAFVLVLGAAIRRAG